MISSEDKKKIKLTTIIFITIGILIIIAVMIAVINVSKNNSKLDTNTMIGQQVNEPEIESDNNTEYEEEVLICDEYYDVTNPIPVKKDNKVRLH